MESNGLGVTWKLMWGASNKSVACAAFNGRKVQSLVLKRFKYALAPDFLIPFCHHAAWILGWLNSVASRSVGFLRMAKCIRPFTMIVAQPGFARRQAAC